MSTNRWMDKEVVVHIYSGILSESHLVLSESLQPCELYSPWNSPGQNTGVGSLSLLQGIFPTQGSNPDLPHCRQFFTSWATREAQEYWSGQPIPSPVDLPYRGIEPGSPTLLVDSLPTELYYSAIKRNAFESVLMRWMNLEPILQNEVSQKEKGKYCILMHIYRI